MANPTLLLATLDETLAFTDASGAGTLTGVDPIRYATLGAQSGAWVEVGTTNMLPNPVFATDATGWTLVATANRSVTRTTELPAVLPDELAALVTTGVHALAIDQMTGTFGAAALTSNVTLGSAVAHMYSMYMYIPTSWTGGTPRIAATTFTSATGEVEQLANLSLRDQWQRVECGPFTPDAGDLTGVFNVVIAGTGTWNDEEEFWFTAVQVEPVAYATSLSVNTFGDGYSGTTTHIRAASSVSVDQDTVARINPASGAIAFRYKRLIDTGGEEVILTSGVVGAGTDYLEIGVDVNDDLYMEWNSDNAGAERVTIATTIAVDTDYFFYFDWDATTIRASIDNGSLSSDTRAAAQGDWSTGDLTLSAAVGSHVVGPLLIADRPLTTKEIATLYTRSTWGFSTLKGGNRYNIFQLRPRAA